MITRISAINFKANKTVKKNETQNNKHSHPTPLYKALPVAAALVLPAAGTMTSCIEDTRNVEQISWFDVALNRLSDEDIEKINTTRQTPKNTVIAQVEEYKTEYYTDSEGNRQSREIPTGKWHYTLINNRSGLCTGTTVLPEGYIVKKNTLGFTQIVEQGKKSIFLKNSKDEEKEISLRDTIENDIKPINAMFHRLSDKQIENINKTRVLPEGTLIYQLDNGEYSLTSDITGLSEGIRLLPEGYEIRKNVLGFARVVPIDQRALLLENKNAKDTIQNKEGINFLDAQFRFLSDEQIEEINRTKKLPEGAIINKGENGMFYISSDMTKISTGTKTLPKGYEVKKTIFNQAVVVPIGTKSIIIKE